MMHACVDSYILLVLLPCQALAELYVIDGQYENAFSLYADVSAFSRYWAVCIISCLHCSWFLCLILELLLLQLMKVDIFDFIDKHNLHESIREKVIL